MRTKHDLAISVLLMSLAMSLGMGAALPASSEEQTPTAREVLEIVGFSTDIKERVLAGEIVEESLEATSKRDLTAALAFLVREAPEAFLKQILRGELINRVDPKTLDQGTFTGEGSLEELAALTLSPEEKTLYAGAEAGEQLNLSAEEIAALKALGGNEAAVEAEMKEILLARYRAYKKRGLGGIAPYDRGGNATDGAADLLGANDAARGIERFDPTFFRYLRDLPKNPPADLQEVFRWSRYDANGEPTLILTHGFTTKVGEAIAGVQRQYYVSRGYNVEQAVMGIFPVNEGALVVYTNHTSTDQVTGFGGGAKRAIGEKVMAAQLKSLYEKVQSAAEKR